MMVGEITPDVAAGVQSVVVLVEVHLAAPRVAQGRLIEEDTVIATPQPLVGQERGVGDEEHAPLAVPEQDRPGRPRDPPEGQALRRAELVLPGRR